MSEKTFEDLRSLAAFMKKTPGVWESHDDAWARTLGWKNVTSGEIVTISLTKVGPSHNSKWSRYMKFPEGREKFAKLCSEQK